MVSSSNDRNRKAVACELIRAAGVLGQYHCLPATDGNLSARLDAELVLVTKAGIEKRALTESSFVMVNLSEVNPAEASSEWPMHRAIYSARPDITCVLHTHPPFLTGFSVVKRVPDVNLLAETSVLIGEIALVPFVQPGSTALAEAVLKTSATAAVYLLANHGALSVGKTIPEALHRMERAEFLAQVAVQSVILGSGVPIDKDFSREQPQHSCSS